MLAVLLLTMLVAACLTMPIGMAIGLGCIAAFPFMSNGASMSVMLSQSIVTAIDSFSMLSMPFFMMVGTLMARGGLANKLIKVADVITHKMPGGLGMAAVVSCCFFAAISGSGPATCATIGGIMIAAMTAQGYDETYAGCLVGGGSTIGPVGLLFFFIILKGVFPIFLQFYLALDCSNSSSSALNSSSAAFTGRGEDISTPASFNRSMGGFRQPPFRNSR